LLFYFESRVFRTIKRYFAGIRLILERRRIDCSVRESKLGISRTDLYCLIIKVKIKTKRRKTMKKSKKSEEGFDADDVHGSNLRKLCCMRRR